MRHIHVISKHNDVLDASMSRIVCLDFMATYLGIREGSEDYAEFVKLMSQRIRKLYESKHYNCGSTQYCHESGVTLKVSVFKAD